MSRDFDRRRVLAGVVAALGLLGAGSFVALGFVPWPGGGGEEAPAWIAEARDNICGLADLRQVNRPATVRFEVLFRATPEGQRIEKEGIPLDSPLGILLRQAGVDRLRIVCEAVRIDLELCSVWKAIRHVDSRRVPDVTKEALAALRRSLG